MAGHGESRRVTAGHSESRQVMASARRVRKGDGPENRRRSDRARLDTGEGGRPCRCNAPGCRRCDKRRMVVKEPETKISWRSDRRKPAIGMSRTAQPGYEGQGRRNAAAHRDAGDVAAHEVADRRREGQDHRVPWERRSREPLPPPPLSLSLSGFPGRGGRVRRRCGRPAQSLVSVSFHCPEGQDHRVSWGSAGQRSRRRGGDRPGAESVRSSAPSWQGGPPAAPRVFPGSDG